MIRTEYNQNKFEFSFVAYTPEKATGKLPLVIQLHGAGERGFGNEDLYKVDIHGFSELLTKEDFECIVVMPQCPTNSFWVAELQKIHTFIGNLKNEFDIDENRIYLTGLSMGGYGTWYTSMAYPDTFAAIAPVCGGGMVWNAPILKMPIWAFHGSEDTVVYPSESLNMINKIRETRTEDVKLTILDGVGHNAWDKAYQRELLEWLLSKSK